MLVVFRACCTALTWLLGAQGVIQSLCSLDGLRLALHRQIPKLSRGRPSWKLL